MDASPDASPTCQATLQPYQHPQDFKMKALFLCNPKSYHETHTKRSLLFITQLPQYSTMFLTN